MIRVEEGEDPTSFVNETTKRFQDEIESIIYFEVSEHAMKHPKNPKLSKELFYLFWFFLLRHLSRGIGT